MLDVDNCFTHKLWQHNIFSVDSQWMVTDLKPLLAKASPLRSGDQLAGIAAENQAERVRAQMELADVPLQRFLDEPVIPYELDEVTRLIIDTHVHSAFAPIHDLTVGQFREWL